jgi:hypothetical protein
MPTAGPNFKKASSPDLYRLTSKYKTGYSVIYKDKSIRINRPIIRHVNTDCAIQKPKIRANPVGIG